MIPSAANSDYPRFVADQVLTSDNLNDLFGYLDEQGRLIRANLSGIGIVCGLEVNTAADGSSITITKGVGVTSSGYLVSVPEVRYTKRSAGVFDAVKCEYYSKFVNVSGKTQLFNLWELKQEAEAVGTTQLNKSFLEEGEKIVLIFVELSEENNKNCNPNSCDDKGTQITVTFRPLLVSKSDAADLIAATDSGMVTASAFNALPDLLMPRWNVPNSSPVSANDISKAYQNILSAGFVANVQAVLSTSWQTFKPIILQEFPTDPFAAFDLVSNFAFLHNGTINLNKSLHIQYYYDLFSDVAAAYEEFCLIGNEIISECCPDGSLFPRHLLLGEAIPLPYNAPSAFRHHFIYSPLFQRKFMLVELKFLFRRMVLILKSFSLPPVTASSSNDEKIIITPSKLSGDPISAKAIPYYYKPDLTPLALFQNWSFQKTNRNRVKQNLSYYASLYAVDDFVKKPLNYDLESYDFFRLEGIIGKNISGVLDTIKKRISDYRLPINVVALATGESGKGSEDENCCFLPDLQMQYRLLREELLSCLESNIKYWGSIQKKKDTTGKFVFQMDDMPLTYMGNFMAKNIVVMGEAMEYKTMMFKATDMVAEKTFENTVGKAGDKTADATGEKVTVKMGTTQQAANKGKGRGRLIMDETQITGVDTMASMYRDYKKIDNIHMAALPRPKTNSTVENVQYYVLILIDEMESIADLLSTENVSEFDTDSFRKYVSTLDTTCNKLGELLGASKKTDYLVERMRMTLKGSQDHINSISDLMPKMSEDDASKITILLANIEDTDKFIGLLRQNEEDYTSQQTVIKNYYDKLDKDGMMVPMTKNPDPGFVSRHAPMLEKLKSCKCNDAMSKLIYLVEKYHSQLDRLRDINNFSVYTKSHPGIQHKAGVPNGGTFIVVYKGPKDKSQNIPLNTVIADFYLPYNCSSNCTPVEVTFQEAPTPINQPPVARPGDSVSVQLPDNSVSLDGSSSYDPDGEIRTYLWEKESGPEATIEMKDKGQAEVSNLLEGEYTFKLTVTDDDGAQNSGVVTVTVKPVENIPPVANAIAEPSEVTLSENNVAGAKLIGSGSKDQDGEIQFYEWSLSSGPSDDFELQRADQEIAEVMFEKAGTYIFKLVVTDNDGAKDSAFATVVVNGRKNRLPVPIATAEPGILTIVEGQPGISTLKSTGSRDPDGIIKTFKWSLINGGNGATILTEGKQETKVEFTKAGDYEFQLTVIDNDNAEASTNVSVKVTWGKELPQKECGSLKDIHGQFYEFISKNKFENYKSFMDQYSDFNDIKEFYAKMKDANVFNLQTENQIKFFMGEEIEGRLSTWIANLNNLIKKYPEFQLPAIEMLNIHTKLTYYISCIKDIDDSKGEMKKPLIALEDIFKLISKNQSAYTKEQKKAVTDLQKISENERIQVKNNKEETSKVGYVKFLDRIIKNIKKDG